jgi:flagellar hook-associated protein 2
MISSSALFNNPYETQIRQLLQIESRKKVQLQNEQEGLQNQKKALSDIDSKLSSLDTLLTSFENSSAEQLQPLSGTSSDPDAVSVVSSAGIKNPGTYNIEVSQLAKEDIVLSDEINQTDTNYNASGSGSLDITIGSGSSTTINVDTTGLNNQEALETIATEVNDQLGDKLTASVFKLGNGNSKLSFKSVDTGEANRISVSNQQGDFSGLNLTNQFTTDELNANFTIDNVDFQRSSNLVDDAVEGLTFELDKTTSGSEQITVTRDTEEAKANVEEFVKKFNDVNSIIRNKTFLNGETGDQGILQDERSIRNLSYDLRQTASLPVNSLSGNAISSLSSIGIELQNDGSMEIADSDALTEALNSNSEEVANLFSASDGVAASLKQDISLHTSNSGVIDSIRDGIDRKINRLDDRIQSENEYLVQKEEELRAEFAELDQVINQGQRQYNDVLNFQNRIGL